MLKLKIKFPVTTELMNALVALNSAAAGDVADKAVTAAEAAQDKPVATVKPKGGKRASNLQPMASVNLMAGLNEALGAAGYTKDEGLTAQDEVVYTAPADAQPGDIIKNIPDTAFPEESTDPTEEGYRCKIEHFPAEVKAGIFEEILAQGFKGVSEDQSIQEWIMVYKFDPMLSLATPKIFWDAIQQGKISDAQNFYKVYLLDALEKQNKKDLTILPAEPKLAQALLLKAGTIIASHQVSEETVAARGFIAKHGSTKGIIGLPEANMQAFFTDLITLLQPGELETAWEAINKK